VGERVRWTGQAATIDSIRDTCESSRLVYFPLLCRTSGFDRHFPFFTAFDEYTMHYWFPSFMDTGDIHDIGDVQVYGMPNRGFNCFMRAHSSGVTSIRNDSFMTSILCRVIWLTTSSLSSKCLPYIFADS